MDIRTESVGGVSVFTPVGRIDSTSARAVEAVLLPLFDAGQRVLFDFAELRYISSAGLRVLLLAARRSKASGIPLTLAGMSGPVAEVFKISGFDTQFDIRPDRAAALAPKS